MSGDVGGTLEKEMQLMESHPVYRLPSAVSRVPFSDFFFLLPVSRQVNVTV